MSPMLSPSVVLQVQPGRLVIPTILALIGLYLVYTGVDRIRTQRRAVEEFEPVDATIRSAELGYRGASGKSQTYFPDVDYEYEYDDDRFEGGTVFPGGNYGTRDEKGIQRMVDNYDPGDSVTAYVDPDSPDDSYLVEGELRSAWTFVGSGVVLFLVGISLMWYATTL